MWEAEPVTLSADDAVRPQAPEEGPALREACEYLRQILAKPTFAADVFRQAREVGVSEKTLRRAAERLGVLKRKTGMETGWSWSMPNQGRRWPNSPKMTEDSEGAHQNASGNFGSGDAESIADDIVEIDL